MLRYVPALYHAAPKLCWRSPITRTSWRSRRRPRSGATRSPDASWIKSERWNRLTENEKASFAPICPDCVIELRSTSDTLSELQAKMQEYISNGVLLGWLIDRKNRTVHIYRPHQSPQIIENPSQVNGDPELPGFSLLMAKIG
ncbi:Uma2 family endonuclease [Acaryochloris thomasi]